MSAIRKTLLNSVAAANHVCTILHTVANLPFYTVLRAEVRIFWVYGDFSATLYIMSDGYKWGGMVWTGFVWLRVRTGGCVIAHLTFIKDRKYLDMLISRLLLN